MSWASKIGDILKIPTPYFVGSAIISSMVLFVPEQVATALGIDDLRVPVRPYLGVVLILSATVVFVRRAVLWKEKRRRCEILNQLSPEEKQVLRQYISNNSKTQYWSIENGVAIGLEDSQVLYRATEIADFGAPFAFNMHPWAWRYLKKHQHLIEDISERKETWTKKNAVIP